MYEGASLRAKMGQPRPCSKQLSRDQHRYSADVYWDVLDGGCTLATLGVYNWTVHVWQNGFMSNYFDHLLLFEHVLVTVYKSVLPTFLIKALCQKSIQKAEHCSCTKYLLIC